MKILFEIIGKNVYRWICIMLEENKTVIIMNGGLSVCNFSFDRTNIQENLLLKFTIHFNLVFYLIFNNILNFKYDKNATN